MKFCFIAPGHITVDVLNGDTRKSGGAEAQVAYLAAAFAGLGHQVELIYGDGMTKSSSCIIAGVKCIDVYPSWKRPGNLLAFWAVLQESAADLIYARTPKDFLWLPGLFSKLHPESKFVYALANDRECNPWQAYQYNRWFHNPLYALGLRTADVVALQHRAQAQLVKPHTRAKLVLVPNLVRSVAGKVRDYEETNVDAIWIARIRPQKQLHLLLDVVEALPHLQFAVVGGFSPSFDQKMRRDLEHRMQRLENVRFLGAQRFEDVMQLLVHSRILVNTSNWEGFPNTMLEAWSVGVPVVSLQIDPGGVIRREAIGLVSGTVSRMIGDVERLVQTRSLNREMGQRGLEHVRRAHSLEAVCQAFERIMPGMQSQDGAERIRTIT
jgi:glycosyltransferase involved in cell wall biosynthesis